MAESFGKATLFTIVELTGDKRKISLGGRALPYRPITFSGTQRMETTWYPGNPEATIQVFGAAEDETTIRGQWKDRFIKERATTGGENTAIAEVGGEQVADVMALAKAVDTMRRQGQLLEVTWDAIVRRGVMAKFVQTWERRQDLEWEISFQWLSQGDKASPAVTAGLDLSGVKTGWSRVSNSLAGLTASPPLGLVGGFSAPFFSSAGAIQGSIDDIGGTVASIVRAQLTPPDAARRIIGIAATILEEAQGMVDLVNSRTVGDTFDPDVLATATTGQLIGAVAFLRSVVDVANAARRLAARHALELAKKVEPDAIGSFTARQDQDLRDVSTAFYGTQEEWRRILLFNQLSTSQLSRGQVVFVPDLSAQLRGGRI